MEIKNEIAFNHQLFTGEDITTGLNFSETMHRIGINLITITGRMFLEANLNSWVQWKWGKTAFGVEIRSENILSNVLGEELDKPVKVPNENAYFTKSKSRTTSSVFFEHAYYYNNWIATAGLMGNTISESNLGWNFFPGLDLSYEFNSGFKIFTSYNTSLRMPTFTDLYYSGPTNIGNPDLKPEKSASLEGGMKLNRRLIKGHVVFFYRNGKNIIDWVKMSS